MQDIDPNTNQQRPAANAALGAHSSRFGVRDHSVRDGENDASYVALGHASIDRDHRHLLSLVARFASLAIDRAPADALAEAVCDLTEFTRSHFEYEEALMTSAGFPDADAHRMDHAALMQQLSLYLFQFSTAVEASPTEIVESLQGWFTGHLKRFDTPMVQFLLAPGRSGGSSSADDASVPADHQAIADPPIE